MILSLDGHIFFPFSLSSDYLLKEPSSFKTKALKPIQLSKASLEPISATFLRFPCQKWGRGAIREKLVIKITPLTNCSIQVFGNQSLCQLMGTIAGNLQILPGCDQTCV